MQRSLPVYVEIKWFIVIVPNSKDEFVEAGAIKDTTCKYVIGRRYYAWKKEEREKITEGYFNETMHDIDCYMYSFIYKSYIKFKSQVIL